MLHSSPCCSCILYVTPASPAVQWSGLSTLAAWLPVQPLVRELRSQSCLARPPPKQTKKKQGKSANQTPGLPLPHPFGNLKAVLYVFCFIAVFICVLRSTYKWYHFVFLFLIISFSMVVSRYIHVAASGIILFFFHGWVVLPCVSVFMPHPLHASSCGRTFRVFLCLGCCKEYCCELRCACIFLSNSFVWCMPSNGVAGSRGSSVFSV